MAIDRRKYLYRIKRLEIKSWLKYLMIEGKSVVDYVLGELMSGTEITIGNTVEKKFYKFDIKGNSVQDGTPSPESPVPINSCGDVINLYNKNNNKEDYYINNQGTEISNNAWVITDYIEVSDTIIYSGLFSTGTAPYSAWYNENKEYISSFKQQAGTNTLAIETGAKYVRFSVRKSEVDNFSVRKEYENINVIIENSDNSQSQTYTIPVQQPMRSIRTVRDGFIQVNGEWKERHNIAFIESYNGETITTNYMSTTGGLDIGASIQYVLENPTDLPCTSEQIAILENLPKSYNEQTNIYSLDVTPAYIEAQAYVKKEEE